MPLFDQIGASRLYAARSAAPDRGWAGYLLPRDVPPPKDGIELSAALGSLPGSFAFATTTPPLADPADLIEKLDAVIQRLPVSRAIIWLPDPSSVVPAGVAACGLSDDGATVRSLMSASIVGDLTFTIPNTTALTLSGEVLELSGSGTRAAVAFAGGSAPQAGDALAVDAASLAFSGPSRGCLAFDFYVQRQFLAGVWSWGFQLVVPAFATRAALATEYPLAAAPPATAADLIGFSVVLDPADPLDAAPVDVVRSALGFKGINYDGTATTLASWFMTRTGEQITLAPVPADLATDPKAARLVFNAGVGAVDGLGVAAFQVAPGGDFAMSLPSGGSDGEGALLCGLSATETIAFAAAPAVALGQADRLRFSPGNRAFVPRYPLPQATRTGPVVETGIPLLDRAYATSWASVVDGGALPNTYVSQPGGATLYGRGGTLNRAHPTLLDATEGGPAVPASAVFPMLPYGGVIAGDGIAAPDAATIEELERLAVAPTRRDAIGAPSVVFGSRCAAGADLVADADPTTMTTPAGLLVTVAGGSWSKVLLGQNALDARTLQMCLCAPTPPLQQALTSSEVFVVVTDPRYLGVLAGAGDGTCGSTPTFFNRLNIDRWLLAAQVGENRVGDYTNVMIIKGRPGALWDPSSSETRRASLISNPEKWTQAGDFGPAGSESTALSYWLQAYFDDARTQADTDYFEQFNAIAKRPDWTGILILRATIAELPAELAGITAGITDPEAFYAHHFAVEISQIANDTHAPELAINGPSSMFGLIHYVDPDFTEPAIDAPAQPLAPTQGADYDFRVLALKALFANSTVTRFQSTAQITLNRLFGTPVGSGPGEAPYDTYNSIVLSGAYQSNNGRPVYSLASHQDAVFTLNGNIIRRVELTGVQMNTREPGSPGAGGDPSVTWFALEGFIDFAVITANGLPFDLLAYGNDSDESSPRKGLSFSSLGLQMSFPPDDPTKRTFAFVTDEIAFDAGTSTPRAGSLFEQFALQLDGLTVADGASPPDKQGFLPVVTDATLRGVAGPDPWHGLLFRCNLGSPGKLAGDVGLTSTLLVAWAPNSTGDGSYDAAVGLALPGTTGGASLISLENVLKLSIGKLLLTYDRGSTVQPTRPGGFLLMLNEISLRLLGLLKLPPSGATAFFVFGDPQGRDQPSGLGWYAVYRKQTARTSVVAPELRR